MNKNNPEDYINSAILKNSPNEIALLYIGCSTYTAANDPQLPKSLVLLTNKLDSLTSKINYSFFKIGVSSEYNIQKGIDHLKFSGIDYDEISIGNGLGNISLQKYIWDKYENYTTSGLPQIIILKHKYATMTEAENSDIHPQIVQENILYRKLGVSGILNLLDNEINLISAAPKTNL